MSVRPLITEMSVRGEKVSIRGGAQASSMFPAAHRGIRRGARGGVALAPLPTEWDGKLNKMVGNTQSARK